MAREPQHSPYAGRHHLRLFVVPRRSPMTSAVLRSWPSFGRRLRSTTIDCWLTPPRSSTCSAAGVDRATAEAWRIGYAAGDELVQALRWHGLPLGPALGVGLLDHAGREFLAGRIVVPELRGGQPVWLTGRLLRDTEAPTSEEAEVPPPKYLVLRGAKPLLGATALQESEAVIVVEGVFDILTLRQWGTPPWRCSARHARPERRGATPSVPPRLRGPRSGRRGLEATVRLADLLGAAAVPVPLPDGTKDVAELAPRPDGQTVFAAALLEAVGALEPDLNPSPNCA